MNNKFLLFGIATVIGVFVMHGCSEDYYFDEDFDSLAERRMTRSVTEPEDGSGTGEVEPILIFPDRTQIENNAYISSKMEDAWRMTKEFCTPDGCREIGFYIYCNPKTGEIIENVTFVYGSVFPNVIGTTPCVNLGNRNDSEERMVCGVFHTHTSLFYFEEPCSRPVGASTQDKSTFNAQIMPGLVYDYSSTIDNTTSIDAPAMVHYYGKRRREVN